MDKIPQELIEQLDEVTTIVKLLNNQFDRNRTFSETDFKTIEAKLVKLRKDFIFWNSGTFKKTNEQSSTDVPNVTNYVHETK